MRELHRLSGCAGRPILENVASDLSAGIRMREDIYHRMYEVEEHHWWFSAKREIIISLLRRFLPPTDGMPRVADVGCGVGGLLDALASSCACRGVDASATAVEFCRARGLDVIRGSLPDDLNLTPGAFDAVIMSDVMEHVEDDLAAVRAAASLLASGGIMIVTVPAVKAMWSSWDTVSGHKRRYGAGSLKDVLSRSGLALELLSYYNCTLLPVAAGVRLAKAVSGAPCTAELEPPVPWLNAVLKSVLVAERHVIGRIPLPWGLSLVAVLRRAAV